LAARGRGRDWRSREATRSLPRGTLVTPYCKRTRPGRGTNTKAAGFPPLSRLLSPLRARPRADPSGLGHAATFSLVGPGTPRSRNADKHLLQDRAESRAFMALMLQHSGVSVPPVQSAPPPPLQAPVVPAIQTGPPIPSVGPSPLWPVTLAFTSPVLSSVCPQPLVPPASAVTTTAVAVSMTTSVLATPAARPQSESVPAPASTADPGSETDSDPPPAFALLPRSRSDAPSPPPPASDV
jgi:hypothetical protein